MITLREPELELPERFETYVGRHVPFGYSGSALLSQNGRILSNKGFGYANEAEKRPNTPDTVHSLGSVTKQFTAAAVLKLQDMGKLDVNKPLSTYFDGVPDDKKDITLHHLLRHTAGLVDFVGGDYERAERDETVAKALAAPLVAKVGERYQYSNAGYSVLAAVVEKVSGKAYEAFLQEELFKPAGMTRTGYRLPRWGSRDLAWAYSRGKASQPNTELEFPSWNVMGNGEMLSTTGDMHQWMEALVKTNLLSAEARNQMWTPGLNDYGYGWVISDTPFGKVYTHNGGSGRGTTSFISYFPDKDLLIAMFANKDGRRMFEAGWETTLPSLVFGEKVSMPPALDAAVAPAETLAGKYRSQGFGTLGFETLGGSITAIPWDAKAASVLFGQRFVSDKTIIELADTTMRAMMAGSEEIVAKALRDSTRVTQTIASFKNGISEYEKQHGKFDSASPVFALNDTTGFAAHEVIFKLGFEKKTGYLSTFWKDGKYIGRNRTLRELPVSAWATQTADGKIDTYDPLGGHSISLKMVSGDELALSTDENAVWSREVLPEMLIGKAAPEFSASQWLNSRPLDLKSLKGKVVVLDFWTYWCKPCVETIPELVDLHNKYKDRGVVVIGVHCDPDTAKRDAAVSQLKIPYPIFQDKGDVTRKDYFVWGFPAVFIIDRGGIVRVTDPSNFERGLLEVLDKPN